MPDDFLPEFLEENGCVIYRGAHSSDKDGSTHYIDLGFQLGGFGAAPRHVAEHYLRVGVWQAREMIRLGIPLTLEVKQ